MFKIVKLTHSVCCWGQEAEDVPGEFETVHESFFVEESGRWSVEWTEV